MPSNVGYGTSLDIVGYSVDDDERVKEFMKERKKITNEHLEHKLK
jgi:hypothetical protein